MIPKASSGAAVIAPISEQGTMRQFAVDQPMTDLKSRTVSSGLITISAQAVQFVLNMTALMIMARLLSPLEFGLVAMVTAVTGFLQVFNDAGLSTATIQREGITNGQVSNLFWANVAVGGAITALLALSAPAIAWLYHEPRLVPITVVLSTTFLLTTSTVQHLALLKRQMRFKLIAVIQTTALTLGVVVGIGMAWFGFGYWSPVGMQWSTVFTTMVLTWWTSEWRPERPRRGAGTRSLISFGANLTASSLLWSVARGMDGLLIGRFYGPVALGLYSRASALLTRPVEQLVGPVTSVLIPTLSRLQPQPERYRRVVLQVHEALAVSTFLFTGLLLALAHPITLVVLGEKWESASPILGGLSFVALYTPVASVASWLIMSQGRGRDFLTQSVIASALAVVSWLVGLPFGPVGIAVSYSAFVMLVALPLTYYIAGRTGPVTSRDLWGRFLTHLPVWVIVCSAAWVARRTLSFAHPLSELLICGGIGFMAGIAFILIYSPSRRAALNIVKAVKEPGF